MYRNSFKQQLSSTLNPDSIYQTNLIPSQTQLINTKQSNQSKSINIRQSTKSQDKKQFLSIVTKPKKPLKRSLLKNNKKNYNKKNHSVTLGGDKKSTHFLTQNQTSLKSSLCKSCVNLHQHTQLITQASLTSNYLSVQPHLIQTNPQNQLNLHSQNIIQNPKNQQVNKIISHKLNLAAFQPHRTIRFDKTQNQNQQNNLSKFGNKFIRNTSSAGRIYFSVNNLVQNKNSQRKQQFDKPLLTPRFESVQLTKERKIRKNAGFIRSASAPKIEHQQSNNSPRQLSEFKIETNNKNVEINKCIQKMSLIRKQIDQLQHFLNDRLQSSELKNKFMYDPIKYNSINRSKQYVNKNNDMSFQSDKIFDKVQNRCSQIQNRWNEGQSSMSIIKKVQFLKSQSDDNNKKVLTVINPINQSLSLVSSKLTNYSSHNYNQPIINHNQRPHNLNHNHQQLTPYSQHQYIRQNQLQQQSNFNNQRQKYVPQTPLNPHKQQNFQQQISISNYKNLYELKCPSNTSNMQKQIITQIASRHHKISKQNQQNIFYQKHPINQLR